MQPLNEFIETNRSEFLNFLDGVVAWKEEDVSPCGNIR